MVDLFQNSVLVCVLIKRDNHNGVPTAGARLKCILIYVHTDHSKLRHIQSHPRNTKHSFLVFDSVSEIIGGEIKP